MALCPRLRTALHQGARSSVVRSGLRSPYSSSLVAATQTDGDTVNAMSLCTAYGSILGGEKCSVKNFETFSAWHKALDLKMQQLSDKQISDEQIAEILYPHVAEKCTFHPPTYFTHWIGRDEFLLLISSVAEVFGTSFTYHRQWLSPDGKSWALEFAAPVGSANRMVHGIDLVELDEDGNIADFKVMARPPNSVEELKKQMMLKVPPRLAILKAKKLFR